MAQPTLERAVEPAQAHSPDAIRAEFDAGAAQVVHLALTDFQASRAEPILSADEAERARRLIAASARRGFIAGRWLLRSILAALTGTEPRSLELQSEQQGKLFLARHEQLEASFNLSHSGELAAVALVRARRIGIDVEAERPLTDADLLVRRILTARERERFETLPQHARGAALLTAWTRKEAVLKAMGTGVSGGLSSVDVLADAVVCADAGPSTWSVRTLSMPSGFHGAIAIEGELPRVVTWQALSHSERNA